MINHIVFVGRLTRDPELKQTNNGTSICTFTLASDSGSKNPDGTRCSTFINAVVFNNQKVEAVCKFAQKGKLVGVEGKLNQRNYERADGTKGYSHEIIVQNVQFFEKRDITFPDESAPALDDVQDEIENQDEDSEISLNKEAEGITLGEDNEEY